MKALFTVSALLSAAGFCLPVSEKNASLRRQISLALGVILFAFALRPLTGLPALLSDLSQSLPPPLAADPGSSVPDAVGEEAYCLGVRRAVAERFSLSEEEITVRVYGYSFREASAEKIAVVLSGKAAGSDLDGIRSYVKKTFGNCEVDIRL